MALEVPVFAVSLAGVWLGCVASAVSGFMTFCPSNPARAKCSDSFYSLESLDDACFGRISPFVSVRNCQRSADVAGNVQRDAAFPHE